MAGLWHYFLSHGVAGPSLSMRCGHTCCLVLLVLAAGCGGEPEAPPPPPVEVELPPPRPIITQQQFDKLLYDTPYADVVEFFAMEPSRQESTYDEGVEGYTRPSLIAWYIWENPDGSYVKLGFTNKKLTDMISEDLPARPGAPQVQD